MREAGRLLPRVQQTFDPSGNPFRLGSVFVSELKELVTV
jgi:hypothetical protein